MPEAGVASIKFVGDYSALNRELASKVDGLAKNSGSRFGKQFGAVLDQQQKHLKAFATAAKYATAGAAGLAGYGLYKVVTAGAAFEKQMSANNAIAEAHGKQLQKLEKQSIKLGQATFYSASQAAEAQGELIKGGLSVKQVLGGALPAALSLAEAGELELAQAAEVTVNAMKLFGLEGKEAQQVANMLATAANKTTADVSDFAEALKYGGSASKLAGYSLNETVTVLEALAEAGIKGTMAGTTFKTALIQLLKPSKKQAELQKELGLEILTSNGHLKDAAGLSEEFRRALAGMTQAERTKTLATLGGQRGLIGLNALYEKSPKLFEDFEKANAKTGTAQEIAAKKMDNFAGAWEQFKGSLETAEIQIYKGIKPALNDLAEEGERVANRIGGIFGDEHLTESEKFQKALDVAGEELSKLWDEADIPEHAAEAFAKAAPVIAEAAAHTAVFAAEEFGKAFIHAPFIAKVAMGAWLINFIGGKQAFVGIGKLYGKQFGLSFTKEAETQVAAVAPAIAAETSALSASAMTAATPKIAAASQSSFLGPGTGAARKAAEEAAAIHFAEESTAGLGIPNMEATLTSQFATTGKTSSREFIKNFASDVKAGAPAVASSVTAMGGRLASGLATWGIGGIVVGQMTKEFGDSQTATDIGEALQGAGVGAAIGSAIAPGIGTAVGAAIGGAGGFVMAAIDGQTDEFQKRGEEEGEHFIAGYEKNLPRIEKMIKRGFIGSPSHTENVAEVPGSGIHIQTTTGGSGLRGQRGRLEAQLNHPQTEENKAKIEAEIQAIDKAIRKIKNTRVAFKAVLAQMSGDAIQGMGQINKDLDSAFTKADAAWGHGTKPWRKHTVEAMREAKSAIKEGMEAGVIDTEAGQKQINKLLRKIKLISGKDPVGIAEGITKSFKEAGGVTQGGVKDLIKDLGSMPKGARKKAMESIEGMAREWAAGHPKLEKQVSLLTRNMVSHFGTSNQKLEQSTGQAMSHIAQSVEGGATNVGGALSNIFDNLAAALEAVGASKIPHFSATILSAASAYHHTREATESGLGRQTGGPVPGTFTVPGSGSGDKVPMMLPAGSFIENREAARMPFQTGGMTPVVLEPKERVWLPSAVSMVGAANLHARNAAFPRFQKGGETGTLPHPVLSGPEPLRGGAQKGIDKTWKAAEKYLAAHSEPQRVLRMLRAGEAITSKGFPYVYGGGHGSFAIQPVDCSGLVSYILHAGGFLSSPMSVQQGSGLYTLGQSGPGKYFTWGVRGTSGANAHTMIAVRKPKGGMAYFESGGSGGGAHEDSGWDGSFQFRHMPGFQAGGQVGMPKKAQEAIAKYGQEAFNPHSKHFVGWGYQLGGSVDNVSIIHPKWEGRVDKFAEGVWRRAHRLYPGSTEKMPPLFIARGLAGQMDAAGVANRGGVELAPGYARAAANGGYGRQTLLHEWAHVFQKNLSSLPVWEREGGATAFSKWAGPLVFGPGFNFQWPGGGYRGYTERVLQEKGLPWVKKGQFGFQRGGLVPGLRFSTGGSVPSKKGELVGASTYGGPADTVSNPTYGAAGPSHPLAAQLSFAELAMGKALGGLKFGTPLKISRGGKSIVAYKEDIGLGGGDVSGHNRAIDLWYNAAQALGVVGGATDAWLGTVRVSSVSGETKAQNAKEEKEHTYKEEVPATYHGCSTKTLHFPSIPKNRKGLEREINRWSKQKTKFQAAIKAAQKADRPGVVQDLQHNVTDIANHLRELRVAARNARVEAAKKHFSKLAQRKFSKLTGYETSIEQAQQTYEKRGQFAEQVVDLEPIQPELPGEPELPETASDAERRASHNAYEVQREEAEKAFVATLNSYIEGKERPAYEAVLGSENDWRTKILEAESFAAGDWQKQNFLGGFEGRFEDNIVTNVENQSALKLAATALTEQIKGWKAKVASWREDKSNKGKKEPTWIKRLEGEWEAAERQRDRILHEKLPIARSKESSLREVLGQARELFYPGKAGGGHAGAEKYFELLSNPAVPAVGSGSFEEALRDVQGIHWTDQHEILKALPANRVAGAFGGAIWDTQAAIEELGLKISQATSSVQKASLEGAATDDSTNERLELELQRSQEALQRVAIGNALEPVLNQFSATYPPYAGKAHTGAIVPGPPNAEKTMIVRGREGIFTEEQMAALGPATGTAGALTVHVNGDIHQDPNDPRDPIEAFIGDRRVDAHIEQVAGRTRRPLSNGAPAQAWRA